MQSRFTRRWSGLLAATAALALLAPAAAPAQAATPAEAAPAQVQLRDVVLIGNSTEGTVTFLDGHTFANLGSLNVIPDLQERLAGMNLIERTGYEVVRGRLGDKFADDMYVSPDGRTLYVSRANLTDVAAFDISSGRQVWRFKVSGFHADHMTISPDGARLVVSATTTNEAQVIDAATGRQVGRFDTGTYPHENAYSADGTKIYNASIGSTPLPKALEFLKGSRRITVVDATTFRTIRTYEFAHGVRPWVITPGERTLYAQLSYLNGLVEYDLVEGRIVRTVELPFSAAGRALTPDQYPENSAHHGLAMNGDGTKLCSAGTINDYVAILSRPNLTTDRLVPSGRLPYWAVTSHDGEHCLVTNSNDDTVSVIRYDTAQEIARVPVGDFPQRERLARVAALPQ